MRAHFDPRFSKTFLCLELSCLKVLLNLPRSLRSALASLDHNSHEDAELGSPGGQKLLFPPNRSTLASKKMLVNIDKIAF